MPAEKSTEQAQETTAFRLRLPKEWHHKLRKMSWEETEKTGTQVSINELILRALGSFLEKAAKDKEGASK
jgi:hypothetical protein